MGENYIVEHSNLHFLRDIVVQTKGRQVRDMWLIYAGDWHFRPTPEERTDNFFLDLGFYDDGQVTGTAEEERKLYLVQMPIISLFTMLVVKTFWQETTDLKFLFTSYRIPYI